MTLPIMTGSLERKLRPMKPAVGPRITSESKNRRVLFEDICSETLSSRKELNPSGRFCKLIRKARSNPVDFPLANVAPRASASGKKSKSMAVSCATEPPCFQIRRSSHRNTSPPLEKAAATPIMDKCFIP